MTSYNTLGLKWMRTQKNVLIFDSETTGLPLRRGMPIHDVDNWPRIVQIGWAIHSMEGDELESQNFVVRPDGFTIPDHSYHIHGISNTYAIQYGHLLSAVLDRFMSAALKADAIVAHNFSFDRSVVGAEFIRAGRSDIFDGRRGVCTQMTSIELCAIPNASGFKYPSLQELYLKLFRQKFEQKHDALSDVRACAKCFFELKRRRIIE